MLLSTQQNILLKEALKMRSVNTNLELEARITRETRYYTADQFCKLSEFLQNNQAFERKEMDEVLDIKFRTSKQDDKDIITYNIDGRYEGTFIDKDGKLVGSITGDLTKSLKNNAKMLGIYKNYL